MHCSEMMELSSVPQQHARHGSVLHTEEPPLPQGLSSRYHTRNTSGHLWAHQLAVCILRLPLVLPCACFRGGAAAMTCANGVSPPGCVPCTPGTPSAPQQRLQNVLPAPMTSTTLQSASGPGHSMPGGWGAYASCISSVGWDSFLASSDSRISSGLLLLCHGLFLQKASSPSSLDGRQHLPPTQTSQHVGFLLLRWTRLSSGFFAPARWTRLSSASSLVGLSSGFFARTSAQGWMQKNHTMDPCVFSSHGASWMVQKRAC